MPKTIPESEFEAILAAIDQYPGGARLDRIRSRKSATTATSTGPTATTRPRIPKGIDGGSRSAYAIQDSAADNVDESPASGSARQILRSRWRRSLRTVARHVQPGGQALRRDEAVAVNLFRGCCRFRPPPDDQAMIARVHGSMPHRIEPASGRNRRTRESQ